MKLYVEHEYFEKIKAGTKEIDFRDAHITFIDEWNGETLRKHVINVYMTEKHKLPVPYNTSPLFTDNNIIAFDLED